MIQSALDPHGPEAATLAKLIWLFVAVCGVVWALVLIVLALAIRCRHMQPSPNSERRATLAVRSAIAATVLILIGGSAPTLGTGPGYVSG